MALYNQRWYAWHLLFKRFELRVFCVVFWWHVWIFTHCVINNCFGQYVLLWGKPCLIRKSAKLYSDALVFTSVFIVRPRGYRPYCCFFSFLLFLFLLFQTLKPSYIFLFRDVLTFPFSFAICWPYFWYVDLKSGILTIFLVCSPYFWSFDHNNSVNNVL